MPANNHDVNARAVPMSFLVRANGPLRDVGLDGIVHQSKDRAFGSSPAVESAGKRPASSHVGNEIRRPLLRGIALLEVAFLAAETVAEHKRIFKNEFVIIERIDDARSARHGDVARRLLTGGVEVLVPGIHRYGKETAFLPFEGFLLLRRNPHRGGTLALQDVDGFFEQVPVGLERLPGRYLGYIGVVEPSGAFQVDEGR